MTYKVDAEATLLEGEPFRRSRKIEAETVDDALRESLALIIADLHGKSFSKVEVSIGGRHTLTRRVQPQGTAKPAD